MRKRIYVSSLFMLVLLFPVAVEADSWAQSQEQDYLSSNKKFIAHVTPGKGERKPLLEVFESKGDGGGKKSPRVLLWKCQLGNKVAPVEVFMSDNGKKVVTNNEWARSGHGDYVVAFYGKDGLIQKYSMEETLDLPDGIKPGDIFRLMPHSVSSRQWDSNSIKLIADYQDRSYFCVWLHLYNRWAAWGSGTGKKVTASPEMIDYLDEQARSWALKQLGNKYPSYPAYEFLGHLKRPEDRPIIEKLLLDRSFTVGGSTSQAFEPKNDASVSNKEKEKEGRLYKLLNYSASSSKRKLAEKILAEWDGVSTDDTNDSDSYWRKDYISRFKENPVLPKRDRSGEISRFLGELKGTLKLPKQPESEDSKDYRVLDGVISIYLIPETTPRSQWDKKPIVHRLRANFNRSYSGSSRYVILTDDFIFNLETVTPGKYWIKGVWDRSRQSNFYSGKPKAIGTPQEGDYQSLESPVITITAGKTLDNIVIDCTHQVK